MSVVGAASLKYLECSQQLSVSSVLSGGDSLECSWSGFIEKESRVEFYKFGVGRVEGDDSMYEFHRVEASVNSHKATGGCGRRFLCC